MPLVQYVLEALVHIWMNVCECMCDARYATPCDSPEPHMLD